MKNKLLEIQSMFKDVKSQHKVFSVAVDLYNIYSLLGDSLYACSSCVDRRLVVHAKETLGEMIDYLNIESPDTQEELPF